MVIIHAITSAYVIKVIDGGKWEAMFFDVVLMLAVGCLIAYFVPKLSAWAFGDIIKSAPTVGG